MLKIKLFPMGRKNQRKFRIVVAEARSKSDGAYVEAIGFYDPRRDPAIVSIDKQKYEAWLKRGAQPTPTLRLLYMKV